MKNKILNFWYYHKVHVFVALVILVMGAYFILTSRTVVQSDYDIAIVSAQGCSEEQMAQIRDVFQKAGKDQSGDGEVTVNLHLYRFAIGAEGQDGEAVAGLDADLVGNMSGIFLVDDPEGFEEATNGLGKTADAIPVGNISAFSGCGIDDLWLLLRTNTDEKYSTMLSALPK